MTYLVVQGVPLRLWPASRGLAFPIPFLVFFSADERRCAAHVDSLTLHDTISIDLWSFFFVFLREQQRIEGGEKVIFYITYVQLGFVSGAITCAVCYMLYWLRGREGKATGFPLPFSKDDPINCRHRRLLPEQSTTSTHMTAPMLRLELSLVITALRRSVLVLVSISSKKPSSSAGENLVKTSEWNLM